MCDGQSINRAISWNLPRFIALAISSVVVLEASIANLSWSAKPNSLWRFCSESTTWMINLLLCIDCCRFLLDKNCSRPTGQEGYNDFCGLRNVTRSTIRCFLNLSWSGRVYQSSAVVVWWRSRTQISEVSENWTCFNIGRELRLFAFTRCGRLTLQGSETVTRLRFCCSIETVVWVSIDVAVLVFVIVDAVVIEKNNAGWGYVSMLRWCDSPTRFWRDLLSGTTQSFFVWFVRVRWDGINSSVGFRISEWSALRQYETRDQLFGFKLYVPSILYFYAANPSVLWIVESY